MTAIPQGLSPNTCPASRPTRRRIVVDVYCGGGGASCGIEAAGWCVTVGINHDDDAITMHAANHPNTIHLKDDIRNIRLKVDICAGEIEFVWCSPSCTSHSKAKGGTPKDDQSRSLAWVATDLAEKRRPKVIFVENVPDFLKWCPLGKDKKPLPGTEGDTFRQWLWKFQVLGYDVDWRMLRSCDYGVPTSRTRLYVVARCDGKPIVWPKPTHGPGLLPYRTAADCLDFSLPGISIFDEVPAYVPNTMRRIARGIETFVLGQRPRLIGDGAFFGLATGFGERPDQLPRIVDLDKPLGTILAGGVKQKLAAVWICKHNGGTTGQDVYEPLDTVTLKDTKRLMSVELGAGCERVARWFETWLPGVRPVLPIGGVDYPIHDITTRPLVAEELKLAMGFPKSYLLTGTETANRARMGNAVTPAVAKAIVEANVGRGDVRSKRKAA